MNKGVMYMRQLSSSYYYDQNVVPRRSKRICINLSYIELKNLSSMMTVILCQSCYLVKTYNSILYNGSSTPNKKNKSDSTKEGSCTKSSIFPQICFHFQGLFILSSLSKEVNMKRQLDHKDFRETNSREIGTIFI